jgi:hypothetical protein
LDGCPAERLLHAWTEDSHHHLFERSKKSIVVPAQDVVRGIPERLYAFLLLLLGRGVTLPRQQYPGHVVFQVRDATSILLKGPQTLLLELVHGVLELLPLLRREVLNVDVHDVPNIRHLDLSAVCPTGRAKKCVDAKCALDAKYTASRTKLASHAQRITRRASQFFLKINKRRGS